MSVQLTQLIDDYQAGKKRYRFFDLNSWIVTEGPEQLQPVLGVEALVRSLAEHGIEQAVVTSARSLDYDARSGNEELLALIHPFGQLYGAIVWVPELGSTYKAAYAYFERMIAGRVAAVRWFPKRLRFHLSNWQSGPALKAMEDLKLPLLLWHVETDWNEVDLLCSSYPELPVIIEGNDQKLIYHNRSYVPLLARHRHLYLETHGLVQHAEIDSLVNTFGADRLLFGTYHPHNDPDAFMMMVTDADIAEETKHAIAGEHLRRLIDGIKSAL
ncbi:amidohydrolase family protein [Cohnella sp. GCM10020058]|uniref:amidohydrolase family protein n=1 Tax=Cohnella sp. GCM10020058 TaxID=3317330 RepID=UPI003634D94B